MSDLFSFKSIQQEPFEGEALHYTVKHDPVGLLKNCRKRGGDLKKGTRSLCWQLWVACYGGALGIRRKPGLFPTLLEDEYFKQRTYRADIDDLLRLGLLIGTDAAADGPTYKKACYVSSRLQPLFDAEVEPMEVLKRIEAAGGLKRLDVSDVLATKDAGSDADNNNDEVGDDKEGDSDNEDSDDEAEGNDEPAASLTTAHLPARPGSSVHRTAPSRSTNAGGSHKTVKQATARPKQAIKTPDHVAQEVRDGMVILEVEVTQEMLSSVLNADFSYLHVKCAASLESWKRVVAVTVVSAD